MLQYLNIERPWAIEMNAIEDVVESSAGTGDRGESRWVWAGVTLLMFVFVCMLSFVRVCFVQSWPKVLRMTQILIFTKSAASVCMIYIYSRML